MENRAQALYWTELIELVKAEDITQQWGRLMKHRQDADRKALPHGLPKRAYLLRLATEDAAAYLKTAYDNEGL